MYVCRVLPCAICLCDLSCKARAKFNRVTSQSAHVDKWCAAQVFLLTWAFDECSWPCTMPSDGSEHGRIASQQGVESSADVADDVDSNLHMQVHADVPQIGNGIGGGGSSERIEVGLEEGVVTEGVEKAVGALSRVGPSIVCAAAAECGAFMLGASTGMPAVISFR